MHDELVPILHVKDGIESARWYARLGFEIRVEHQFASGMPLYLFIRRGGDTLHLSEHQGDDRPGTLLYLYVDDVDPIAREFNAVISEQPWARELHLTDPDGNPFRVGERKR